MSAQGLLFGTGGVPLSATTRSTISGIERIAELGLECMEVEFVQGVKMSAPTAAQVKQAAQRLGVRLTAHGPYAVNLNSADPEKARASKERVVQTARVGALCGAESIVFHAGFYGNDPPESVYRVVKLALLEIADRLRREGNRLRVRTELTGKGADFGTLDEVLRLSSEIQGIAPCIDFAHLHARTGKHNSYAEFLSVLDAVESRLGRQALENVHMHVSGIEYTAHGETKHLPLKESDFKYRELLQALKDRHAAGFVVCESPNLEEDALLLQQTYRALP